MSKPRCPGQDTRYWRPGDLFEVPCRNCGKPIEFFKDDLKRPCPHCGKPALNPNNDLACAAWCRSAKECLEEAGQVGLPDAQKGDPEPPIPE